MQLPDLGSAKRVPLDRRQVEDLVHPFRWFQCRPDRHQRINYVADWGVLGREKDAQTLLVFGEESGEMHRKRALVVRDEYSALPRREA